MRASYITDKVELFRGKPSAFAEMLTNEKQMIRKIWFVEEKNDRGELNERYKCSYKSTFNIPKEIQEQALYMVGPDWDYAYQDADVESTPTNLEQFLIYFMHYSGLEYCHLYDIKLQKI